MISIYTMMAISSITRAKWRSTLTMLGVVIGVFSVVMVFSLGEGVKDQIAKGVGGTNSRSVVIYSGKLFNDNQAGEVKTVNWPALTGQETLKEVDLDKIKTLEQIESATSLTPVAAAIHVDDLLPVAGLTVIASTPQFQEVLGQNVEKGEFFATPDLNKNLVILGSDAALKLFPEDSPIGRTIKIKNIDFTVRGVLEHRSASVFSPFNTDFNNSLVVPYGAAKALAGGVLDVRDIRVKIKDTAPVAETITLLNTTLLENHQGNQDFTVIEPKDLVGAFGSVLVVVTKFIAAVAAVSLIVGGIGIMNIMLVSVSERTREIGIRKAIGATNQQILGQFMVEAMILSTVGGAVGIALALLTTFFIRLYTTLDPVIVSDIMGLSLSLAVIVGLIFGLAPAIKAARKDPIRSLRGE